MIDALPSWMNVIFLLIVLATIGLFYYANSKPVIVTLGIVLWSVIQSVIAGNEFYRVTDTIPPRFILVLLPTILLIIYGLLPRQRKWILESRDLHISTFLHTIRIPVEIILFYLLAYKMVPELMTFEGRNFDIMAGISAPIIGWLFIKGRLGLRGLLVWNYFGLALILFILINGILSAELPIQQFAFDQPNRAMTYFPYVLLPATIVPIVLYTHISDIIKIRHLQSGNKQD